MGSRIGSGIFIVSADVSRQVKSPGLLIVCWLLAALLTILARDHAAGSDRHNRRLGDANRRI